MMITLNSRLVWLVVTSVACLSLSLARLQAETVEWIRQLGTGRHEDSLGVTADALGNVYVSGETRGALGGVNAGGSDAFITKYDAAGTQRWRTKQFGTSGEDHGYGISADGLGNVYVTGSTSGSFAGPNAGSDDAFVGKYDAAGTLMWMRQLGTSANDEAYGVSADGVGNVYISGYTGGNLDGINAGNDAFVSKYDAAGNLLWTRQSGMNGSDGSNGVSADGLGNVYISGYSAAGLDGDAFISKYDAAGTLLWTRLLGNRGFDESLGVSADGLGNIYISGNAAANLGGTSAGGTDAFVAKYDATGTLLWIRQLGTSANDEGFGVSADGLGNVYLSGRTRGSLGGTNAGLADAFISKFNAAGTLLWTQQLGTSGWDGSLAVSADGMGNVYFSGGTEGSMGTVNAGFGDAFVAKISDAIIPEPTTLLLLFLFGLPLTFLRRRM